MITQTRNRVPSAIRPGFSLIELLIAIAILLAIGALVARNLLPVKAQAEIDIQRAQFDVIDGAMEQFKLTMNRWPAEEEGLAVLWNKDALEDEEEAGNWRGPYLKNPIVEDKWGNEIIFRAESEIRDGYYDLLSWGPDGEEDTEDDITNHDRYTNEEGELSEEFEDFTEPGADEDS